MIQIIIYSEEIIHPRKLIVWAGIFIIHLVSPFFSIQGTPKGNNYLELLEVAFDPRKTELLKHDRLMKNKLTSQHDGTIFGIVRLAFEHESNGQEVFLWSV